MQSDFNPASIVEVRPASSLAELATAINASHESLKGAISAGLTHARKAGQCLLAAKKQVGHGHWLDWLKKNITFSRSTVSNYIRVAERWEEVVRSNVQPVAHLNFKEALQLLAAKDDDAEDDADGQAISGAMAGPTRLDSIAAELQEQIVSDVVVSGDGHAKFDRARRIGELLLSARKLVGETAFESWFDDHVDFTRALGRAYVAICLHGFKGVSYDDALEMLQDELPMYREPMAPAIGPRPTLPEPLAILGRAGLLDDESLTILMMIRDDYGPEVVEYVHPETEEPEALDAEGAFWLFNTYRPLDQPTLWPGTQFAILPDQEISASPAVRSVVLEAAQQFVTELFRTRRGQVLRWEGVALWYASIAVLVHSLLPDPAEHTVVGIIRNHVATWRESLHTSLVMFLKHDMPKHGKLENASLSGPEWWGYHSDLRHAGILDAAKEIKEGQADRYPSRAAGHRRFLNDICERGTFPQPSSHQGRLDKVKSRPIEEAVETGEKS